MAENGTLPLSVVSLPDGVYNRKTMKCSYRPQWGMSIVILYFFGHCATAVTLVRFIIQAKGVFFLDFVRNKDRTEGQ